MPFSDLFGPRRRGWKPKTILVEPSIKPDSDESTDENDDDEEGDDDSQTLATK